MPNRQKFYTEIDSSVCYNVAERLLARQNNRGEGSFYLRQARANIMKNYQKTDLLEKNNQYSKKYAKNLELKTNHLCWTFDDPNWIFHNELLFFILAF